MSENIFNKINDAESICSTTTIDTINSKSDTSWSTNTSNNTIYKKTNNIKNICSDNTIENITSENKNTNITNGVKNTESICSENKNTNIINNLKDIESIYNASCSEDTLSFDILTSSSNQTSFHKKKTASSALIENLIKKYVHKINKTKTHKELLINQKQLQENVHLKQKKRQELLKQKREELIEQRKSFQEEKQKQQYFLQQQQQLLLQQKQQLLQQEKNQQHEYQEFLQQQQQHQWEQEQKQQKKMQQQQNINENENLDYFKLNNFKSFENKITIDVAVLCQEYTTIEKMSNDHIVNLDEIEVTQETFQTLFYPFGENFGLNKNNIVNNELLVSLISFLPEYRRVNGKNFYLLEKIISNLESDLNVSRNCFTVESLVELSNEITNLHSFCDLNCCSVLSSLTWPNILEIIKNYKLSDLNDPSNPIIPICIVSIIFKTPTNGVKNTIVRFNYRITDI